METYWSNTFDFGVPNFHLKEHVSLYQFKRFMQFLLLPGTEVEDEDTDWIPEEWETKAAEFSPRVRLQNEEALEENSSEEGEVVED